MHQFRAVFTGINAEIAMCYIFEAPHDLFNRRAMTILSTAMESVERAAFSEHHDYEIYSVYRGNSTSGVIGIGYLMSGTGEIPFTISVYKLQ